MLLERDLEHCLRLLSEINREIHSTETKAKAIEIGYILKQEINAIKNAVKIAQSNNYNPKGKLDLSELINDNIRLFNDNCKLMDTNNRLRKQIDKVLPNLFSNVDRVSSLIDTINNGLPKL